MSSVKPLVLATLSSSLLLLSSPGLAGILVDPAGLVEALVADPTRNVLYATLDTDEVVVVDVTSATVTDRETVTGDPGPLAVSGDGSKLYVALDTTDTVAEYDLPGLTFNRTFTLSSTQGARPGLVANAERLYVVRSDGLSVVDTTSGAEIYYGSPVSALWSFVSVLRLSPDGNTLYAMDTGLSPASIFVLDVSEDTPRYIGEDCCHGCIGGNGRGMELSADGAHAYVVVGGQYHLQVLETAPMLHDRFAGLTGPFPNAVVPSPDGSHIFVGYQDAEFAAVRTSDWLPYHVGALQGDVVARGLALAFDQETLAAVIEFTNFDPDRIELINVATLVPNRGGIRLRPLDDLELVPIRGARIQDPPFDGNSDYFDMANGLLGRAPIVPDTFDADITAPGHATITQMVTVAAGTWTDLGDVVMTRTGDMPDIDEVCGSPAAEIGRTVDLDITGRGFFAGAGLDVTTSDPDITIESFAFQDWSTITATVSVVAGATEGKSSVLVTNPDGNTDSGTLLKMPQNPMIFADGFESGDTSAWSSTVP